MINVGRPRHVFETHLRWVVDGAFDVLDIGTTRRFSKELAGFSHLFEGKNYIAAGFYPNDDQGTDNRVCHQDIQSMTFPDASFDAILCIEVLEHVTNPFLAASEIVRTLRPGGRLFLTTPFLTSDQG
jgi:SAM-dependent methyltransferase